MKLETLVRTNNEFENIMRIIVIAFVKNSI